MPAIDLRFIRQLLLRRWSLFTLGCEPVYWCLFVSVTLSSTFANKTCTYRIQNPKTHEWVVSGGERQGSWARRARQKKTPTALFAQDKTVPRSLQGIKNNCPICRYRGQLSHLFWTSLRKHEQEDFFANRWTNKARCWPAVDKRFIRGTTSLLSRSSFLAADQCSDTYLSL